MCSFIVLMHSVRMHNLNSLENKEKPLNEGVFKLLTISVAWPKCGMKPCKWCLSCTSAFSLLLVTISKIQTNKEQENLVKSDLYLVFSFIQHFLNSLLQMVQRNGWWKFVEASILQHVCYSVLRSHSPRTACENICAFEEQFHWLCSHKVKDTSLLWELMAFSLCMYL